jgi:nucleoside phosphorylase
MSDKRAAYDLGLIIPTREEFDYIRGSVPFTPISNEERGIWYEFWIPGGRLGVAHVLFDMGLTATTSAAFRLLDRFRPEVLAVVGIGGGLNTELRLGDVVVGSVIQEYLKGAKVASDMAFQPAGDGWPLAERLRNFTNHFPYIAEDCCKSWVRFAKLRGIEADLPFMTTPGARREPAYFVMPIASGDLVVTDPAFTGWLLSHDRKRAVIEMESAGAARAVKEHDHDVALLVLRGISDFADGRKAVLDAAVSGQRPGAWRRYAAENAIELLFAFLASPSFPWRTPITLASGESGFATPEYSDADAPASRSRRAWDYFMQAAQLVEAAAAGAGLWHSMRSGNSAAGEGRHGSDEPNEGDQEHRQHGPGHGHHVAHDTGHDGTAHDYHQTVHDDPGYHGTSHDAAVEPEVHIDANIYLTDPSHYHDPHG